MNELAIKKGESPYWARDTVEGKKKKIEVNVFIETTDNQ
jgi:hypothetical protein